MSSAKFSEFVMDIHDLYNLGLRNGYYLPLESSSAVNEVMLYNVLQNIYLCPKYQEIQMKACPKHPINKLLFQKLS
jgi:hypothetical protein